MQKENFLYLQQGGLFSNLTHEELHRLAEIVIERKFKKNSIIFFEGDQGDAVYFVKKGRLKVTKASDEGGEQILHLVDEGDIFGEVVLFDGGPYPATAQTITDCLLGIIRNEDMEQFLRKSPEVALKLLKVMSYRLRQAQIKIRNLALQDTLRRTVGMLLHLAQEHGVKTEQGIEIELPLNRQELANMIGTSRETITRILSRLNKEKIIILEKQKIIILNEEELMGWI